MFNHLIERKLLILIIIFAFSSVSCQTKTNDLKISDFTFEFVFGEYSYEPNNVYCLLGNGFFRTPSAENTESMIVDWINNHPNATVVPISSIDNPESKIIYCWVIAEDENLNVYLVKNGCFPGGTMERPATWYEMEKWEKELFEDDDEKPNVEVYVSRKTYKEFIKKIKAAEVYARSNKLGIWS